MRGSAHIKHIVHVITIMIMNRMPMTQEESIVQVKQGQKVFWSPSTRAKPTETRVVH